MYNYVVTARKPSRVSHTAVGNFFSPHKRNLIVAKVNHILIYTIAPEGLVRSLEVPIHGTICVMHLMRMPGEEQDHLIILTEKYKLCILKWNAAENKCHVVSEGNMQDHISSQMASDRIGIVDPNARCIALHLYPRLLKVVPTERDADKTAFNVRMVEDQVHDMVFLNGCPNPTVAVLCSRAKDTREMRTYEINMHDQDITDTPWRHPDLDITMAKMHAVPKPYSGLLLFGDDCIMYLHPKGASVTVPIDSTLITAVGQVDAEGKRYLIGDHKGQLMMLMLQTDEKTNEVRRLKVESLGETSSACCISYMDSGFAFIGSDTGDSQLIRLSTTPNPETKSYVEVVQSYTHLGPIVDFCIVKGMGSLRQGQGQVVTCSGVSKDGSLRVIRNGIGISEHASEELPGIKALFSLRRKFGDRFHAYLLQSFTSETRVLELIESDEMAPASLPGFDETSSTIYAANLVGDVLVQVTSAGVYIMTNDSANPQPSLAWAPPAGLRVSVASGNGRQLLIGTVGGGLTLLVVDEEKHTVRLVSHVQMDREISCVNCNPLQTEAKMSDVNGENQVSDQAAFIAAVGLWAEVKESPKVKLVALPSLTTLQTVELGGDVIARCVLLVTLDDFHFLLVALGDGYLLTYSVNGETANNVASASEPANTSASVNEVEIVSERRKLSIGTQPADLRIFKNRGADHVFAACDRPTVVYSATQAGKLLISNVNLQEVFSVCGFDTEAFPECLAIATESELHLGAVDEIQKLHISPIRLGEQPRRITHMESARVFAVLTESTILDENGDEALEQFIRIIDDTRYDTISKFKLRPMESGSSILVASFTGEGVNKDEQFLVVGTAVEKPNEPEPTDGRIMIFRFVDGRLITVAERDARGAVYSLCAFNGMLLATVGPEVRVLSLSERKDGMLSIKEEDRHHGHILAWKIALRGDFILVGDIFRSITVLTCKKIGDNIRLEEVARDFDVTWVLAMEMLDDDIYIVAEHSKHLYTYQRNSYAATDAERGRLERVGQFHLGSRVNRIQHGSLVLQMPENEGPALKTMIFGTTDGMLGVIANLKPEAYRFFNEVQTAMATIIPGIGGLNHQDWREMVSDSPPRSAPAKNFLDGDLIERFLDLNLANMKKVSAMVNVGVEELVQRVEEMQRLHGAG